MKKNLSKEMYRLWKIFKLNGRELYRYSMVGSFDDEEKNTKELLAFENNCEPCDIEVVIEKGKPVTL